MTLNRLFTCFVLASIPVCASALAPADFTLAPGLTARLVLQEAAGPTYIAPDFGPAIDRTLANGALLIGRIGTPFELRRLNPNGTVDFIATVRGAGDAEASADAARGTIWLLVADAAGNQAWLIEGLPRTLSAGGCPSPPGDLAPGTMDNSTSPPTWRVIGDSAVDISDVVTVLRAAVGLQTIECGP